MEQITFNQVVSRGCGIDVHQKVVVATVAGEGLKKTTREFSTFTSSLTELREWLLELGITHVAMESTGVYWNPVYHILEPTGMKVWIVNARHIKYVPGHKTDKKDSAWICKLLLAGLLKPSFIPPREQRELRDLTRYRVKLIQGIAANKNRINRILEDCNIKLSSVMSGTDGVVATKLIDKLIEGKQITLEDIDRVYHGKLKASKAELQEACNGFITEHHVYMLGLIKRDIAASEVIISDIDEMLSPYDNVIELLKGIPGFNLKTAQDLIAEIGLDMSVFPSEKHLSSWVGISPGNNESAGKKKWTNHPRQQIRQSGSGRSSLGGHKNEEYILQCEVSPAGSKTGQEKSPGSHRTFDPEICLPYTEHRQGLPGTWSRLYQSADGSQTQVLPEERVGKTGLPGGFVRY